MVKIGGHYVNDCYIQFHHVCAYSGVCDVHACIPHVLHVHVHFSIRSSVDIDINAHVQLSSQSRSAPPPPSPPPRLHVYATVYHFIAALNTRLYIISVQYAWYNFCFCMYILYVISELCNIHMQCRLLFSATSIFMFKKQV